MHEVAISPQPDCLAVGEVFWIGSAVSMHTHECHITLADILRIPSKRIFVLSTPLASRVNDLPLVQPSGEDDKTAKRTGLRPSNTMHYQIGGR